MEKDNNKQTTAAKAAKALYSAVSQGSVKGAKPKPKGAKPKPKGAFDKSKAASVASETVRETFGPVVNTAEQDAIRQYKPDIPLVIERTVNGKKWSQLTWIEQFMNSDGRINGRPAEKPLELVSPEFQLMTSGVGALGTKGVSVTSKIGRAALYGGSQGAVANLSNLTGSKQDIKGILQDIVAGGITGGALKGAGVGAQKVINSKAGYAAKNTVRKIGEEASEAYYRTAPWTFKPNPDNYYRVGIGRGFVDDVFESGKIRAVSDTKPGPNSILLKKTFAPEDTYFSKGVPLRLYGFRKKNSYLIEADNSVPFLRYVNGRLREKMDQSNYKDLSFNEGHKIGDYVIPKQARVLDKELLKIPDKNALIHSNAPLDYNPQQFKLYKKHWFKGYTQIHANKADV